MKNTTHYENTTPNSNPSSPRNLPFGHLAFDDWLFSGPVSCAFSSTLECCLEASRHLTRIFPADAAGPPLPTILPRHRSVSWLRLRKFSGPRAFHNSALTILPSFRSSIPSVKIRVLRLPKTSDIASISRVFRTFQRFSGINLFTHPIPQ